MLQRGKKAKRDIETYAHPDKQRVNNPPVGLVTPETAKDIDEMKPKLTGMQFLKVQMNADLLTEDLKRKRASNESFWLIGQPDVEVLKFEFLVFGF